MFAAKIYYIKRNFKTIMSLTVIQHLTLEIRQYNDVIFKIQSILKFAHALYAFQNLGEEDQEILLTTKSMQSILKLSFTVI